MQDARALGQRNSKTYLKSFAELYDRLSPKGFVPPQAVDLEEALLGAMMIDSQSAARAMEILRERPEVFYREGHEAIYRSMLTIAGKEPVDLLTVKNELERTGKLESVGGPAYLVELTTKVVTTVNVESYARILLEKYIGRELIRICEEVKLRTFEGELDTFNLLDEASEYLFELSMIQSDRAGRMRKLGVIASESVVQAMRAMEHTDELSGVTTGFRDLDAMTNGWQDNDLIVLAARPSQGKTALALNFVRAAAIDAELDKRVPTAVFSLEMSDIQLGGRLLAQHAALDMTRIRKGRISDEEFRKLRQSGTAFQDAPVFVYDVTSVNVSTIRQQARQLARRLANEGKRLGLIVIDYLQLVDGPRAQSREREIAEITKALKQMAREMKLPVLLLAQLSREVEKRQVKRPQLSDLRESGAVEQDSDIVLFIYRPEAYGLLAYEDGSPTEGIAEIIIGKQREGPVGEIKTRFIKPQSRFENIEPNLEATEARFESYPEQQQMPINEAPF